MQTKSFSSISADKELDETALGYDPGDYDYHYIQVLGSSSETWSLHAKAVGSSVYAPISTLNTSVIPISGMMAVTPNDVGNVSALKIIFSDTVSGLTILVASMNRHGLGVR
tara:strand:- start:230 stop:562 length:333 start_codon:yes stop_codon:yes gene_type:complete